MMCGKGVYPKVTSNVTFLKSPLSPINTGESEEKSQVTNHIFTKKSAFFAVFVGSLWLFTEREDMVT